MQIIDLQYEISLITSKKGNLVIQLKLISNGIEHCRYGETAIKTVNNNVFMYGKDTLKYIKGLKKYTDDSYNNKNK